MEKESDNIHGKISGAILQFQDRVSQILTHVVSNMNSLRDEVETNADGDFDIEAWLRGMTRDFTTQEEFETFHGTNISNANENSRHDFFSREIMAARVKVMIVDDSASLRDVVTIARGPVMKLFQPKTARKHYPSWTATGSALPSAT